LSILTLFEAVGALFSIPYRKNFPTFFVDAPPYLPPKTGEFFSAFYLFYRFPTKNFTVFEEIPEEFHL